MRSSAGRSGAGRLGHGGGLVADGGGESDDRGAGRRSGWLNGRILRRLDDGASHGESGLLGISVVLDAELSRPLVCAGGFVDDQETVAGDISLERDGGSPFECAAVGCGGGDGSNGDDVLAGATEQADGHGAWGGCLPGDGVLNANGDLLLEARAGNGVAAWGLGVVGLSEGRGDSREGSEDDSRELHCECVSEALFRREFARLRVYRIWIKERVKDIDPRGRSKE